MGSFLGKDDDRNTAEGGQQFCAVAIRIETGRSTLFGGEDMKERFHVIENAAM